MKKKIQNSSDRQYYIFALKIAGDFGVSIAAPIILSVMIGSYLGDKYGHRVLFIALAFILAGFLSTKMIHKKAKVYGEQYQNLDKE